MQKKQDCCYMYEQTFSKPDKISLELTFEIISFCGVGCFYYHLRVEKELQIALHWLIRKRKRFCQGNITVKHPVCLLQTSLFFQPDQTNLLLNSPTKIYSDQSDQFLLHISRFFSCPSEEIHKWSHQVVKTWYRTNKTKMAPTRLLIGNHRSYENYHIWVYFRSRLFSLLSNSGEPGNIKRWMVQNRTWRGSKISRKFEFLPLDCISYIEKDVKKWNSNWLGQSVTFCLHVACFFLSPCPSESCQQTLDSKLDWLFNFKLNFISSD